MNPEPLHIAENNAAPASSSVPVPAAAPASVVPAAALASSSVAAPAAALAPAEPSRSLDARVKVLLLFAYSAALFFVDTAAGMAYMAALVAAALAAGRVSARRVLALGAPAYVLAAFAVLFGSLVYAGGGGVALDADGFFRGCMNGARIVLLVFASFAVSLTATSSELADALGSFLRPLRRFRVPVDDATMVFSVALRFIPVTADELSRVRDAQLSRGSKLVGGGPIERLRAWSAVFVPVFVGLFRRADALAQAMDARCYGASRNGRGKGEHGAPGEHGYVPAFTFLTLRTHRAHIPSHPPHDAPLGGDARRGLRRPRRNRRRAVGRGVL